MDENITINPRFEYLPLDVLEHLDELRKPGRVIFSRENMVKKLIEEAWGAQPMQAPETEAPVQPTYPVAMVNGVTYAVDPAMPGIVASHFTINPRPGDDQPVRNLPEDDVEPAVERHLEALHDAVDAVAEVAFGPVTVTAETRLHGGGTFKQTATIDYGLSNQ
jgi:hypothetical protein